MFLHHSFTLRRYQKANFSYYFLKIHTLIQRTTKNIQAEQAKIQISILKILKFRKRKCVFNKLHLQENCYASLLLINVSVKNCTGWWSKRTDIFRTCFCREHHPLASHSASSAQPAAFQFNNSSLWPQKIFSNLSPLWYMAWSLQSRDL